jgi:hypothetical protein
MELTPLLTLGFAIGLGLMAGLSHMTFRGVLIMIIAGLCGASASTEFALFAEARKPLPSRLTGHEHAPSHDTFSRLLRLLAPAAFIQAFARLADGFGKVLAKLGRHPTACVVAVHDKALRRAYERGCKASPPLTVSAFAVEARLCLAAVASAGNNVIEAALKVVGPLDLTRTIVTADALNRSNCGAMHMRDISDLCRFVRLLNVKGNCLVAQTIPGR